MYIIYYVFDKSTAGAPSRIAVNRYHFVTIFNNKQRYTLIPMHALLYKHLQSNFIINVIIDMVKYKEKTKSLYSVFYNFKRCTI